MWASLGRLIIGFGLFITIVSCLSTLPKQKGRAPLERKTTKPREGT